MIRTFRSMQAVALMLALAGFLGGCATTAEQQAEQRVVIQVSDGDARTWNQALNVVQNLRKNYADRKMDARIELVAFGMGIQMLKDDAVVANRVRDSISDGTDVVACENSMGRFKLSRNHMLEKVRYVDAGVIEIVERQKQGWAVIRP